MKTYDYLIVGAGFAGLVMAERLSSTGKRCLVVDKRGHIGGNCYDEHDEHGVLVHKYGPHYFRTNSERIKDYLSRFTEWQPVVYEVKSYTDGKYWSFPINLRTFEQLIGRSATEDEFIQYLREKKVNIPNPKNSEELIVSQVGYELYEKFFKGYTFKQWRRPASSLDPSVCGRIPIRMIADERYFNDSFQALPKEGYTRMFERMLAMSPGVELRLNVDYREVADAVEWGRMIYTGPIDEFYDLRYGRLKYRSLRFEREHIPATRLSEREAISGKKGFWQPALQVNYPNSHEFTRIVELKHATGQQCPGTTIVREYPMEFEEVGEPYYPIPAPDTSEVYRKYAALAEGEKHVFFVGRLATYRYYNMDQVVGMALKTFENLESS